jgi:hypothetical protein
LQKISNSEKSYDKNFEEQRQKWEKMFKMITNVEKDLRRQRRMDGIAAFTATLCYFYSAISTPFISLAEGVSRLIENPENVVESKSTGSSLGTSLLYAVEEIDQSTQDFMVLSQANIISYSRFANKKY